jgi:sugar/nucleoside kinase (ribokinase family)
MILVLGDLNVDVMARLSSPIVVGEDCPSQSLSFHCGGVGVNVAFALAGVGTRVRLVGCTGNDWFGEYVLSQLAERGVDISHVRKADGVMSGMMFIAVGPDGQRTIFGSRGANREVPGNLESSLDGVTAVEIAGYAFLNPSTAHFAEDLLCQARDKKIWAALDIGSAPSQQVPDALLRVVHRANTVFANAGEALRITGQTDTERAFTRLEENGCEVVLKLGRQGCQLRIEGRRTVVPPFCVQAVDTTGAGDAFTAAFMAARLWGWPAAECALFANAAGAAATSVMGAGEHMPDVGQIAALLECSQIAAEWDEIRCDVIEHLTSRRGERQ